MNISKQNMISPNEILADVLLLVGDESMKDRSKGYYLSLIQQALQELAFDTFFDERTEFFDVPENLVLPMPKGAFNIRQIYLYDGDRCTFNNSNIVWWKRNFFTKGDGYLARDKGHFNRDPFYSDRGLPEFNRDDSLRRYNGNDSISSTYYYNVQNGNIMFSSSVRVFPKVAIVYNGIGADIGEAPFVPQFFREAIKTWVVVNALKIKMAQSTGGGDFNKWQALYSMHNNDLTRIDGIWYRAELRAKSMDSKEREDMKEYLSRLDY